MLGHKATTGKAAVHIIDRHISSTSRICFLVLIISGAIILCAQVRDPCVLASFAYSGRRKHITIVSSTSCWTTKVIAI